MNSIFLSYSRSDDEPFVRRLYQDLSKRGFDVWWDRVSMPSRALTFLHEIRESIMSRDRLILVIGPRAVLSDYVTAEWRYAFETGKAINPILRVGNYALLPEELKLLDTPDFRDDDQYTLQLEYLIRQIAEPIAPMGKLLGVPSLPPHIIKHPDWLSTLKDSLLSDLRRPVVVMGNKARVGIHGMAGIGKSVLATMLARDNEVRRAFPDSIIWIPFGQQPSLGERLREVARFLDDPGDFRTTREGSAKLGELLADRAILLILDDVWDAAHIQAFDVLGPRCRMVITTRDVSLITALGGIQYQVQLPTEMESLALMAQWAECPIDELPQSAPEIMNKCGRLPLALSICGAMVRDLTPWKDVLVALREADIQFLDHPHGSILRSIKASVDVLTADQQRRFAELAVFKQNQPVPEETVLTLWNHTGNLEERDARQLLIKLERRSLLNLNEVLDDRTPSRLLISMHDLLHDYAVQLVDEIKDLHKQLIDAYGSTSSWFRGANDGYFLQNLVYHLAAADDADRMQHCFREGFVEFKKETGFSVYEIQTDYFCAMDYFLDRHDIAGIYVIAASYRRDAEPIQLPNYESYLVWYGACLRSTDDRKAISNAISYIQNQPAGQDRLRMVAEFLIGLDKHPTAQPLQYQFQEELERLAQRTEESGIDLLAAEALGNLSHAFELAMQVSSPGDQRLCRIFKLIRRHREHPAAFSVFTMLLNNQPNTWSAWFDSTIAGIGLLPNVFPGNQLQASFLPWAARLQHEPTAEAAQIALYLIGDPSLFKTVMAEPTLGPPNAPRLQRAMLYLAWFDMQSQDNPLVRSVVASRSSVKCPLGGKNAWQAQVLMAHLDRLEFIYSSAHGYKWHPHEAILVPIFALWAQLFDTPSDLHLDSLSDLSFLAPHYERCFKRDIPTVGNWIEFGQALCCVGKAELASDILNQLHKIVARPKQSSKGLGWGWSAFVLFFSPLLLLFLGLALGLTIIVLLLFGGFLVLANLIGLIPQTRLFWNWLWRKPASAWLITRLEKRQARGQSLPIWLRFANTWNWQIVVSQLLNAGRSDLAKGILDRGDYGNAFRELRPWCFRSRIEWITFLDFFMDVVRSEQNDETELWCQWAKDLSSVSTPSSAPSCLISGLPLVSKGLITLRHLIMITRRFQPDSPIAFRSKEDIDRLAICLGELGENSAGSFGIGDFLDACHTIRYLELGYPYDLAVHLLKVAMARPKGVLAEVLYEISHWSDLHSPELSIQMRKSYQAVIQQEIGDSSWVARGPLFFFYRSLHLLQNLFVRPSYSQPFDLVGYAFGSLMRKIVRW